MVKQKLKIRDKCELLVSECNLVYISDFQFTILYLLVTCFLYQSTIKNINPMAIGLYLIV